MYKELIILTGAKMRLKFISLLLSMVFISNVSAKMPFYDNDAEFERCIQMFGDWDRCMNEETRRALNDTKVLYRDVLANPKLIKWNGKFEENQQVLRDMYSSWTAFRNRLCSLSKVASRYTGGWKDEELSCNLYYVKHHKDHFQSINNMLRSSAKPRDDFISDEHDEQYFECIVDNPQEKCLLSEFQRSSEKIKELYKKFYDLPATKAWNNGTDLGNGNYRDMFDSWVAYRNRLCSLSEFAYAQFQNKEKASKNYCLQYLNREKLETLNNLYELAQNAIDDDKLRQKSAEGGKSAGKSITALQNRIESVESLVTKPLNEEQTPEGTSDSSKQDEFGLPSWAKRK